MFNFLSSCGFCSNVPRGGDYAYEVFNKVPIVGGIFGNLSNFAQKLAPFQNAMGNMGAFNSLIGQGQQKGQFDFSKFMNNTPAKSILAGDSAFKDLANNHEGGAIKKILKSNYN